MTMKCIPRIGLTMALTLLPALSWGCTVSSTGIAFGGYNPFDSLPTDSTTVVTVDCGSSYSIALSEGQAATFNPRAMAGEIDSLQYNLYTDADYSVIWGDGSGGTQVVSGTGIIQLVDHVIHGRIFAQQNALVGSYADTITVTLQF